MKKSSAIIVVGVLAFRSCLDFVYKNAVTILYGDYHLTYSPDKTNLFFSYAVLLVITGIMAKVFDYTKPSSIMVFLLYLLAFVPNTSLYYSAGLPHHFMLYSSLFWFTLIVAYRFMQHIPFRETVPSNSKGTKTLVNAIPISFFIIVVLFSVYYNGLRVTIDVGEADVLRMASRESSVGPVMSRLIPWAGIVVFPVTATVALKKGKYLTFALFAFAEAVAFSFEGTKTYLFAFAFSVFTVLFLKRDRFLIYIPLGLAALTIFGYVSYQAFDSVSIMNYLIRRVFFATSYNNWGYIEFFRDHELLYLRYNGFMSWLRLFGVEKIYGPNISSFMGSLLYDDAATNAASGTVANAYSNLGIMGLLLFPIVAAFMYRLLDRASANVPLYCVIPVIIGTAEYLLNGDMFSVMATYGYLFALVYLHLASKTGTLPRQNPPVQTTVSQTVF